SPPNAAYPVSVTMDQARSITANYRLQYQLSLATATNPATSPSAVALSNITGGTNGQWIDSGTSVSLTAAAQVANGAGSRYDFRNWTGDVASPPNAANPVSVTMDQARSITANYRLQYQLSLATATNPATSPSAVALSNITGGTNGQWIDSGTSVSLTAAAQVANGAGSRYDFRNWTGDVASPPNAANPVTVTMDQARSITANYRLQYQLTLATATNPVTSPSAIALSNITGASTGDWFDSGTVVYVAAAQNPGNGTGSRYDFRSWTGDSTATTSATSVTMSAARSLI